MGALLDARGDVNAHDVSLPELGEVGLLCWLSALTNLAESLHCDTLNIQVTEIIEYTKALRLLSRLNSYFSPLLHLTSYLTSGLTCDLAWGPYRSPLPRAHLQAVSWCEYWCALADQHLAHHPHSPRYWTKLLNAYDFTNG